MLNITFPERLQEYRWWRINKIYKIWSSASRTRSHFNFDYNRQKIALHAKKRHVETGQHVLPAEKPLSATERNR